MNDLQNLFPHIEGAQVLDAFAMNGIRFAGEHTVLTPEVLAAAAKRAADKKAQ